MQSLSLYIYDLVYSYLAQPMNEDIAQGTGGFPTGSTVQSQYPNDNLLNEKVDNEIPRADLSTDSPMKSLTLDTLYGFYQQEISTPLTKEKMRKYGIEPWYFAAQKHDQNGPTNPDEFLTQAINMISSFPFGRRSYGSLTEEDKDRARVWSKFIAYTRSVSEKPTAQPSQNVDDKRAISRAVKPRIVRKPEPKATFEDKPVDSDIFASAKEVPQEELGSLLFRAIPEHIDKKMRKRIEAHISAQAPEESYVVEGLDESLFEAPPDEDVKPRFTGKSPVAAFKPVLESKPIQEAKPIPEQKSVPQPKRAASVRPTAAPPKQPPGPTEALFAKLGLGPIEPHLAAPVASNAKFFEEKILAAEAPCGSAQQLPEDNKFDLDMEKMMRVMQLKDAVTASSPSLPSREPDKAAVADTEEASQPMRKSSESSADYTRLRVQLNAEKDKELQASRSGVADKLRKKVVPTDNAQSVASFPPGLGPNATQLHPDSHLAKLYSLMKKTPSPSGDVSKSAASSPTPEPAESTPLSAGSAATSVASDEMQVSPVVHRGNFRLEDIEKIMYRAIPNKEEAPAEVAEKPRSIRDLLKEKKEKAAPKVAKPSDTGKTLTLAEIEAQLLAGQGSGAVAPELIQVPKAVRSPSLRKSSIDIAASPPASRPVPPSRSASQPRAQVPYPDHMAQVPSAGTSDYLSLPITRAAMHPAKEAQFGLASLSDNLPFHRPVPSQQPQQQPPQQPPALQPRSHYMDMPRNMHGTPPHMYSVQGGYPPSHMLSGMYRQGPSHAPPPQPEGVSVHSRIEHMQWQQPRQVMRSQSVAPLPAQQYGYPPSYGGEHFLSPYSGGYMGHSQSFGYPSHIRSMPLTYSGTSSAPPPPPSDPLSNFAHRERVKQEGSSGSNFQERVMSLKEGRLSAQSQDAAKSEKKSAKDRITQLRGFDANFN